MAWGRGTRSRRSATARREPLAGRESERLAGGGVKLGLRGVPEEQGAEVLHVIDPLRPEPLRGVGVAHEHLRIERRRLLRLLREEAGVRDEFEMERLGSNR